MLFSFTYWDNTHVIIPFFKKCFSRRDVIRGDRSQRKDLLDHLAQSPSQCLSPGKIISIWSAGQGSPCAKCPAMCAFLRQSVVERQPQCSTQPAAVLMTPHHDGMCRTQGHSRSQHTQLFGHRGRAPCPLPKLHFFLTILQHHAPVSEIFVPLPFLVLSNMWEWNTKTPCLLQQ